MMADVCDILRAKFQLWVEKVIVIEEVSLVISGNA